MSLKPKAPQPIPEGIKRWGERMLPQGNVYRYIGDQIYGQLKDADFADMYPPEGQPGLSPVMLVLVLVMQYLGRLSDRGAAEAVQVRLDWKYALHLAVDYEGFDYSVLSEFRDRLLAHEAGGRVFGRVLELLVQAGLLKKRGRQRSDSLTVLTKMRDLTRLELVLETLRLALEAIVAREAAWAGTHLPPSWEEQYGHRAVQYQMSDKVRQETEQRVGGDGYWLLDRLAAADTPAALRELEAVVLLGRVWEQRFIRAPGRVQWRAGGHYDGHQEIHTPHDPEARWSAKRGQGHVGYRLQTTDSDDDDQPHLITDIALDEHTHADVTALPEIQQRLAERDLLPGEQNMDGAYFSSPNARHCQQRGIKMICPARQDNSPQSRLAEGLTSEQFSFDWENRCATCPAGQRSYRWHEYAGHGAGEVRAQAVFARQVCAACPLVQRCVAGTLKRTGRNVTRSNLWPYLQAQRQQQETDTFRQAYKRRGGIEGTLSVLVRGYGMRRMRYVGRAKGHLQALFTAIAFNLRQAAAWLAGHRPKKRRAGLTWTAAVTSGA